MAEELRMALAEVLRKAGVEQADFLREGVRVLAQELMELELAEHLGAERHERTLERTGYRNGYRERPWDTRVGTIELKAPRARWSAWCRRRTCKASAPDESTTWCRRSACRASPRARSVGCALSWTMR